MREPSECVRELLGREAEILARLEAAMRLPISARKIRCHGDYHLGQVLWTGKDFVIIDFEGEPARPLSSAAAQAPAVGRCRRHDPVVPLRVSRRGQPAVP